MTIPHDWDGRVAYGGGSAVILVAPFSLPHKGGEHEGPRIAIPTDEFVLTVADFGRQELDWPPSSTLFMSGASSRRRVTFNGLSIVLFAEFAAGLPSDTQVEEINRILSTASVKKPLADAS